MSNYGERAGEVLRRINELAAFTEEAGSITRTYGSNAFIKARKQVQTWMEDSGLETRTDNIGNVRGRLKTTKPAAKTCIIASHIDTVVNAGKFDGSLGIIMGLDLLNNIIRNKIDLPFNIELIGFADEEGVRFHSTFLGSKAVAGSFDTSLLSKSGKDGVHLSEVIQQLGGSEKLLNEDAIKDELLGYFEIHIEQGPVLYELNIPVAVVSAIAGQKRIELVFSGVAGHAGTVPMSKRHDALCCAAECITGIEEFAIDHKANIVATVGTLDIADAASNVIPGKVTCTLDVRSADEVRLSFACNALKKIITGICTERNIACTWNIIQETETVTCDSNINAILKQSIKNTGYEVAELVSGAGHDVVPFSAICPVSMMFVRCYKGISHNPLEDVELTDIAAAIKVADNFMLNLALKYNR